MISLDRGRIGPGFLFLVAACCVGLDGARASCPAWDNESRITTVAQLHGCLTLGDQWWVKAAALRRPPGGRRPSGRSGRGGDRTGPHGSAFRRLVPDIERRCGRGRDGEDGEWVDPAACRCRMDADSRPSHPTHRTRRACGSENRAGGYAVAFCRGASTPGSRCDDAPLSAGADVSARNRDGSTPLHSAAGGRKNSPQMISVLVAAGADVVRGTIGETPLQDRLSPGASRLVAHGADARNKGGL